MNQTWDPEQYAQNVRFVSDLGMSVVELLNPKPGEKILDLGCGDGALTEKLAKLGCDVIGVDQSAEQIEAVKARGLNAQIIDGQQLTFKSEFDAVFSNAALHWMKQADVVIQGVYQALKPQGRFVAEFGGKGNVASVTTALLQTLKKHDLDFTQLNPWYFPTVDDYRGRLEAQGFQVATIELIPRPTPLPGDIDDWFDVFVKNFLSSLDKHQQHEVYQDLKAQLKPTLFQNKTWIVDYVRLRFSAFKSQK